MHFFGTSVSSHFSVANRDVTPCLRGSVLIYPQARRADVVVHEQNSELLVRDQRRKRTHKLSEIAAWVWARCDGHTPVTLLAERMRWFFRITDPLPVLQATLEKLARCRLLEVSEEDAPSRHLTRRDLVTHLFKSLFAMPFALLSAAWI